MSDKLTNPCTIGRDAVHCRLMFPGICAACGFSRSEQLRRHELLQRYGLSTAEDGRQYLDTSRDRQVPAAQKETDDDELLLCDTEPGADGSDADGQC